MKQQGWKYAAVCALALGVSLSAVGAVAQPDAATTQTEQRGGRGERGGQRGGGVYGIALALPGITAEQKEKIEKLQADNREKMRQVREQAQASGGGMRNNPEIRKMMEESRTQIEAILTEEQKKEFQAKLSEMQARWGNRGGGQTTATEAQR